MQRVLGVGVRKKEIREFSTAPGPLPAARVAAGAACLSPGQLFTQPGVLGTSDTLVSVSQGCGSCSGSSAMLSALLTGDWMCTGMEMPMRKTGSVLPSVPSGT